MSVETGAFQSQPSETPILTTKRTAGRITQTKQRQRHQIQCACSSGRPFHSIAVPSLLLQQLYVEMGCCCFFPLQWHSAQQRKAKVSVFACTWIACMRKRLLRTAARAPLIGRERTCGRLSALPVKSGSAIVLLQISCCSRARQLILSTP